MLSAMLGARCPHCREGKMFPNSLMSYRRLGEVNEQCSVCNTSFNPEVYFYFGAMYVSYAFSVALMITTLVALNVLLEKPELWMYLTMIAVLNIGLLPLMHRYSKVLYLYMLSDVKYRGY